MRDWARLGRTGDFRQSPHQGQASDAASAEKSGQRGRKESGRVALGIVPGKRRIEQGAASDALLQGGQRRELRLPQYPEVEALVAALRGALAGSQALLQSHYALALAGSEGSWQLALTPLDEQMRRRWLRKVTIRGARGVVQSVEMEQADGDRSLMEIRPAPAPSAAK